MNLPDVVQVGVQEGLEGAYEHLDTNTDARREPDAGKAYDPKERFPRGERLLFFSLFARTRPSRFIIIIISVIIIIIIREG